MCELRRQQEKDGTSLGVFKPADVQEFTWDQEEEDWSTEKQGVISQPSLLVPTKTGLEKIPYRFRYRYRCSDPRCNGHHQSIIDWELAGLYRRSRQLYNTEEIRLQKIEEKWLNDMCSPEKTLISSWGIKTSTRKAFLFWECSGHRRTRDE